MRPPRCRIWTLMVAILYIGAFLATVRAAVSASAMDWMFRLCCIAAMVLCLAASTALTWMFEAILGSHSSHEE